MIVDPWLFWGIWIIDEEEEEFTGILIDILFPHPFDGHWETLIEIEPEIDWEIDEDGVNDKDLFEGETDEEDCKTNKTEEGLELWLGDFKIFKREMIEVGELVIDKLELIEFDKETDFVEEILKLIEEEIEGEIEIDKLEDIEWDKIKLETGNCELEGEGIGEIELIEIDLLWEWLLLIDKELEIEEEREEDKVGVFEREIDFEGEIDEEIDLEILWDIDDVGEIDPLEEIEPTEEWDGETDFDPLGDFDFDIVDELVFEGETEGWEEMGKEMVEEGDLVWLSDFEELIEGVSVWDELLLDVILFEGNGEERGGEGEEEIKKFIDEEGLKVDEIEIEELKLDDFEGEIDEDIEIEPEGEWEGEIEDVIDFEGVMELVLEAVKDSDPLLETDFDGEGEKEEVLEGVEDLVILGEPVVDLDGLFEGLIELEIVREGVEEGLEDLVEEGVGDKLLLLEGVLLGVFEGQ